MLHESEFSGAFARIAESEMPRRLRAAVVSATQGNRLAGHIARDSTAVEARERVPEAALEQKRQTQAKKSKCPKRSFRKATAAKRGARIERQRHQKLEEMLACLPRQRGIGARKNSQGHDNYWRGYKLHLGVAGGPIPVPALLTSASVHDSRAAIPLITMTPQRVESLYDLLDSAYDAGETNEHSRRGAKKSSPLTRVFPAKPAPEQSWAQRDRYKKRTMSERVNRG